MKVKFLESFRNIKEGEIIIFSLEIAKALILIGVCEEIKGE